MATNWWEIGKPVQDLEPVAQENEEQNWWEVGQPVDAPREEPPARGPVSLGPLGTIATTLGVRPPRVLQGLLPTIGEGAARLGYGVVSRAVDRLPDSIDVPPPGVPIEDIDRAGGVREYYAQVYGIRSDEDLQRVKAEARQRTEERVEASQRRVAEVTPEDLNIVERGVRGGLESLALMAPGVAASVLTRSPAPALTAAGALEGFGGYAEARAEGLDPNAALAYGGINAAIEVATEAIGVGPLMKILNKSDIGGVKQELLKFAAREVPAEQAATLLQSLNALAFDLDEELANAQSAEEAARIQGERQAVTFISTIVAGGVQAGGVAAINKVRENNIRRDIEARVRDMEGIGSEIEREQIQALRDQALEDAQTISAPELPQLNLEQGQTEPTPLQFGESYATRIFDSVGQYIPSNAEFKVEEKDVDGVTRYVVTDQENRQYGQVIQSKDQADALALSLNNTGRARAEVLQQLEPLYMSLNSALKGYGLNDINLTLNNRIFTRRGEALTSEGLFDPVVRQVFLAVDAIDPQGNLDTNQRREALRGVLRHEVVHALRYLDLWKKSEWKNLERTVAKTKKPGTNKTYLEIAKEGYSDQTPIIQVEEAVAELIRDVAARQATVSGKPRSLSERAVQFFDRAKNALTGSGFQTYEDIVRRFEQGEVGARQRGKVRTFRATEEQAAQKGYVPERLQRILKSPEGRNQFRQDTLQNLISSLPTQTFAAPAMNSLQNAGIRESRSTIEQVPPTIKVEDQEFPTRDSEGRLIYSGYEGPEVFGVQTAPTDQGLRNFWNRFKNSKIKDRQGRPLVYYHGTGRDITAFRPKQAGSVFITRSPTFAEEFSFLSDSYMVGNFTDFMPDQEVLNVLDETLQSPSAFSPKIYDRVVKLRDSVANSVAGNRGIRASTIKELKEIASQGRSSRFLNAIQTRMPSSANVMPVYVNAEKPWDYQNKEDVKAVVRRARDNGADVTPSMVEEISQGNWQTIEGSEDNAPILDAIRELGYDSMYVEEAGQKNLAVFNPNQIKSAIGNNGEFGITPDIRESRRSASEVFENNLIEEMRVPEFKSKEKLIEMNIDDFLNLAKQGYMPAKERDISSLSKEGKKFSSLPFLQASLDEDGVLKVVGHEGRHRARFLRNSGYQSMPVVLRTLDPNSIRWSEQDNPESFDYVDNWPTRIEAEDSLFSIPMPVSREQSIAPYEVQPSVQESRVFPAKATPQDEVMAEEYERRTGELPYLSEGQLEPVVPVARQSIKKPYEAKDLAKGRENDPITGLPLNKNGTVTLYFPATNDVARRTIQEKRLRGATDTSNRVYLTNESSGPKVMENPGNIDQPMDGANVLIHVDPSLIHFDQEYPDGRKDFFIQLAEGQSYADKMRQAKLFTLDAPRTRALSKDTKLVDIERSVTSSITNYLSLNPQQRRERLKQARQVLKRQHNVGTLLGENGKLQKTRLGDYGLTYNDKSVASMGLGLASAQRINENNLSTCPLSAMCEGLCLGETSGQNLLYGGEGQFKSGPRLSQYLKTEALVQSPEDFAVVLYDEIAKFERWANSERGMEWVENEAGEKVSQPKQIYQPAIRLNVTSDFRPQTFESIINAFPDVMFYDYTKLPTRSIAANHHLTYSSTGASQVVNGETIVNPGSNWDKMVQRLNEGLNVAMAFTSRTDMPKFILDERTGQKFQVWNGDNYDARFLDPKREDGIGMVIGLTNKDRTTKPEDAAKKWKGFFLDYDPKRDGDTLIIRNQQRLRLGVAPVARESRRPTVPGPSTDTDGTATAESLNNAQPVNSIGTPSGPLLTDTMPDGTVDISRAKLQPLVKRLVRGVEFIQSAPDKLRGGVGLGDIAGRIEGYYDTYDSRLGEANGIIRDAFKNISLGGKDSALETFQDYIRARENKRTQEAAQILLNASESDKQLILAWNRISRLTGRVNLEVKTPSGQPMKVWDSKEGAWRPIKAVQEFFPRTLRREVLEVMKNPDLDPNLYEELLDSLIESGRASNRQEADNYLVREWFTDEIKQDYFAGVEKARTEALPEIFYDYSWDAATRYIRKWARRTSQIEYFGQELGQFQKEWFGENIPKIRDQETQNYLNAIRERIYEIEPFDTLSNMMSWANSLATGLQLGNPVSASLNLLGGTITNIQAFGIRQIAKSYLDLALDWKNVQREGTTLGILNKDFLNILNDHVEREGDKYFGTSDKISVALAKFADTTLTVGGFNAAENVVRSSAMLAARSWLNDSLRAINTNPESKKAKKFFAWIKKENLNADKLIEENGAGKETERFLRRAVNVPQGSYRIDMTPVFIDTPAGRFFLKYQKFGTQVNRFFYNHFLKPFMDEPTPTNFYRVLGFLGTAVVGGSAILMIREALGYGDPGPDEEEILIALKNEDTSRAMGLIFTRAWENILAAGSLGFFANYAQFLKDWQDQQRVKNPLNPPGLASIDVVVDLFNRINDQKKLTARDIDEVTENAMSLYRAYKRLGLAAMDEIGVDAREVKRFAALRDLREVREYGRRYTEEMEIEGRRRAPSGPPIRTPMTPVNKAIADALMQGDSMKARQLLREATKGVRGKERQKILQSVRASVRNRQPIQVGGNAPNQKERREFLRWAKQNLPADAYQKIRTMDRKYRRAASRIGMSIG